MGFFKKTTKEAFAPASASKKTLSARGAQKIVRPLVTEKTAHLSQNGQYVFVVDSKANRLEIRQAIRAMYGVMPISVNIQNVQGKIVRFGHTSGKRKDWKKAIVTLPKGKTIEVYEGV